MSDLIHVTIDLVVKGNTASLMEALDNLEVDQELQDLDMPNVKYLGIHEDEWWAEDPFEEN